MVPSSDDTLEKLLAAAEAGDLAARDQFVERIYQQLHRLAAVILSGERKGGTLQTTALVNEALLHLVGDRVLKVNDRRHFLNVAAVQMRRILIDRARARYAEKRRGGKVSLEDAGQIAYDRSAELVALDNALKAFAQVDPGAAAVVDMKYFGGYTDEETAEILGINFAKVRRDWAYARAWLHDYLEQG
ncbi:MAG: sigma-70 family RNA polymerase sigma factor [Acidobacteriia bacterium]|nr:sigma-70 family RNA polymerase sigma factor [Terriglobia bacterium]